MSLGILLLRIYSLHTYNNDLGITEKWRKYSKICCCITISLHFHYSLDIYVKVTLYEGGRVIKAKKTRQLSCSEVLDFNEKFSIRLPASYLDNVSCLVSLCSRNKYGLKAVMGRTNVGPFAFANGQGNQLGPGRN